jgi:predicted nucleotide-binding protein (sugar kinase/HSP70/actin superfamily)
MVTLGQKALRELASDPERFAVVIFARPYNGFVEEAHMGIPHKLASRGVLVLPLDFLPLEAERSKRHMYWGMGQRILRGARLVKRNPQLFGTYITNFSCGPDSFLVGYFRSIMGRKPSLTLELDSHTADAGLDTRIEAFLDITTAYRQLMAGRHIPSRPRRFQPARTVLEDGQPRVITSDNRHLPINDPRVTVVVPSMGQLGSEAITAVFKGLGLRAYAHPAADEAVLKLGRGNTSCKECLPLILTTGTLLNYVHNGRRPEEVVVYFMPTGSGPCRFGQYSVFMEDLVQRLELPDVAMLSLSSENSYLGMSGDFERRAWWAVIVSDVMEDVRSMLLANAQDPDAAGTVFRQEWQGILKALEQDRFRVLESRVARAAERLRTIALKRPVGQVPIISLTGEIFVRRDALSRRYITEELAKKGFATVCAPVAEWVHYCDYMMGRQIKADYEIGWRGRLRVYLRKRFLGWYEKRLKLALARSGLVHAEPVRVEPYIATAAPYIAADLPGEAVLTVGGALTEVAQQACGVIAIGPFGCMPNRLSESLLNEAMNREGKLETDRADAVLRALLADVDELPFLAIESDGSPFPQLITAKLETFCLRAERLHARMQSLRGGGHG